MKIKRELTELSRFGEFKLIEHLTGNFELKNKSSIKGVGDDAAVIRHGKHMIVLTTDLLVEGINFNLMYTPLKHLGYKSVVVGLSDIYAMNARPQQITVSIAVSNKIPVGSPCSSRWILPFLGSGVLALIPLICRAAVLTQAA